MFTWLKNLFRRKPKTRSVAPCERHLPPVPKEFVMPPPFPRMAVPDEPVISMVGQVAARHIADTPPSLRAHMVGAPPIVNYDSSRKSDSDDDFLLSAAVGMMTNNALLGYAAGGSFAGGLAGDIAANSSVGSYDSGSDSSSCDSGGGGE